MFQHVDLHELLTDSTKEERLLLLFIAVSCDDIRLARQIIKRGHAGICTIECCSLLGLAIRYGNIRMFFLLPETLADNPENEPSVWTGVISACLYYERRNILATVISDQGTRFFSKHAFYAPLNSLNFQQQSTAFLLDQGALKEINRRNQYWKLICTAILHGDFELIQKVINKVGFRFYDRIGPP